MDEDLNDADEPKFRESKNSAEPKYQQSGRLWEILCVLTLALGLALVWHGVKSGTILEVLAALISFGFGLACFFAAVRCANESDLALERSSKESLYLISRHRIETLEQVNAPNDVTGFLRTLFYPKPITRDKLLGELRTALGAERTNEVKTLVLKYTRFELENKSAGSTAAKGN